MQTKAQGLRAKLATSPLEMEGQRIVPSVTRFFTQQQTLYVFFQAYYPEKGDSFDANALRAGLIFFRNGVQVNTTPMLAPTSRRRKDAHGFVPHQPAAGQAAAGPLQRAGHRDRRGHAAIGFRPRLSGAWSNLPPPPPQLPPSPSAAPDTPAQP